MIKLEGGGVHIFVLRFCAIQKITRKEFVLDFGHFEAQCSYKIVLIKEQACKSVHFIKTEYVLNFGLNFGDFSSGFLGSNRLALWHVPVTC